MKKDFMMQKASHPFPLPIVSLNHVSFLCSSVQDSIRFYQEVLGFQLIRRPSSFDFDGAWLYNYGVSIHLVQPEESRVLTKTSEINPRNNHISFQCADVELTRRKLDRMGIDYVTAVVKEGGIMVDQLFFHDPDGNMIEICDCQKIPVVPLSSEILIKRSQSDRNYRRYHSFTDYAGEHTR